MGTLGGTHSSARSLNRARQVVGVSETALGDSHAFLWSEGNSTRDLGTLKHSSGEFLLGAGETFAPGSFFSGLLDEVRFYNVALRPAVAAEASAAAN